MPYAFHSCLLSSACCPPAVSLNTPFFSLPFASFSPLVLCRCSAVAALLPPPPTGTARRASWVRTTASSSTHTTQVRDIVYNTPQCVPSSSPQSSPRSFAGHLSHIPLPPPSTLYPPHSQRWATTPTGATPRPSSSTKHSHSRYTIYLYSDIINLVLGYCSY
jgi:hypothetical protein